MPAISLFRALLAFALLLMPLAMIGQGHAMAAMPQSASASEHCHEGSAPAERDSSSHESGAQCAIACAALPSPEARVAQAVAPAALPLFAFPAVPATGLAPEAETPPPRIA
ncbi:MAG TPA: hypothetical protein VGB70_00570 [Allosphingosinicella sp.]|jgi:hypothetical protein